ncbi:MAG: 7,8-dihydropterin-6-yl-methyl-4-(beta-D-ribofuranosyl)aminobenzene 5-phosphate synthase [Acidobacteriota bacterium]|nr:7,8-dihydropterin-6-yl-methyl-4-(beta-D-ribofuranosyl)aminobenzene 5-phosphate synthase [Acidobacteriota bacterium]
MQLTVLVDNNTYIDRYFYGEPGVSYLIQEDDLKILFDVGYSDLLIKNAQKMDISLWDVDSIVISHGHIDHTGGLEPLIKYYTEAVAEHIPHRQASLVAHPLAFNRKQKENFMDIGSLITKEKLALHFQLNFSQKPLWLSDKLVFLGEIERTDDFEAQRPLGKRVVDNIAEDDYLMDDSALVYKSPGGMVIITGCSHAGICNIVAYAGKVCREERIVDIIGGFHLLQPGEIQLQKTLAYLKETKPKTLHACHCTDLRSKIALAGVLPLEEVGVGLRLEY